MRKIFRNLIYFWNTERFPYENFRFWETKTLTKKRDTAPSSPIHKIFYNRNFLKHRKVALRTFSVLWDKNFDKNLWYNPLFSFP